MTIIGYWADAPDPAAARQSSRTTAGVPVQALADWLASHHLKTGLTGWNANTITLDTDGRVLVLVTYFGWSRAVPDVYQSKASWYDPRLHYADFVVSTTGGGPDPVSYRIAAADFGRPARVSLR